MRQSAVRENTSGKRRRMNVWLFAAFIIAVFLLVGVYDVVALPGCASCHDAPGFRAATKASPHAAVDCRSCHVPADVFGRVAFASRQPFGMYIPLARAIARDVAAVPDSRCVACHDHLNDLPVVRNGLRIAHASCASGAVCSDCHSNVAHGESTSWARTYSMDSCLGCHVPEKKTACDLCHEGRLPSGRITSGSFAVTHGPEWRSTHGMGDATTCMVCHTQDDCVGCHGAGLPHDADFFGKHGTYSIQAEAKCSGCHEESFCNDCHQIPMPHGDDFTQGHALDAAEQPALCERCHADSDCTTCHEKHVHPGGAIGKGGDS